jgi:hypothetical protein
VNWERRTLERDEPETPDLGEKRPWLTPTPPRGFWGRVRHRILHIIKMQPCDLIGAVHEEGCKGHCAVNFVHGRIAKEQVCKVKLKLKCRECGEEKLV